MHPTHVSSDSSLVPVVMSEEVPPPVGMKLVTVGREPEGGIRVAFAGLLESELDAFLDKAFFAAEKGGVVVDRALFDARQQVRSARRENLPLAATPDALRGDWWIEQNEKPVGPLTFDQVQAKWDDGLLSPDTLCWRRGYADWIALDRVPEAVAALSPTLITEADEIEAEEAARAPSSLTVVTFGKSDEETVLLADDVAILVEEEPTAEHGPLMPELSDAPILFEAPRVSRSNLFSAPQEEIHPGFFEWVGQGLRSMARVVFT